MDKIVFPILISFLLVIGSACTKKSEVKFTQGRAYIDPSPLEVIGVEVIPWGDRYNKNKEVSKGIRMGIRFPILSSDEVKKLVDDFNADSWAIRVIRRGQINKKIGWFYSPIYHGGGSRGGGRRFKSVEKAFLNIYYAAAAMSTRFENFRCPAFGHKKKVTDFKVVDDYPTSRSFIVSPVERTRINGRVNKLTLRPPTINGEMSIVGEFYVEIALYNSKKKQKLSNWVQADQHLSIRTEGTVQLRGCANFEVPEPEKQIRRKFKFGR